MAPHPGHARLPVTQQRREIFLEELRKTGSVCAAAKVASPHCEGYRAGFSSFTDLAKRDPEFAAELQEARAYALGVVEGVIADHAINGVKRPIFQGGKLAGHETIFDHNLLLRMATRLDPAWSEKKQITHANPHDDTMLSISVSEVLLLDPGDQELLVGLVAKINEIQNEPVGRVIDTEIRALPAIAEDADAGAAGQPPA